MRSSSMTTRSPDAALCNVPIVEATADNSLTLILSAVTAPAASLELIIDPANILFAVIGTVYSQYGVSLQDPCL